MMTVLHIVAAQSSGNVESDQKYIKNMQDLVMRCNNPATDQPYIKELRSGREQSAEGYNKGMQLVFIFEFVNKDDRDYFINEDPAHKAFVQWVIKEREGLDFTPDHW